MPSMLLELFDPISQKWTLWGRDYGVRRRQYMGVETSWIDCTKFKPECNEGQAERAKRVIIPSPGPAGPSIRAASQATTKAPYARC